MKIIFSSHALARMRERFISKNTVMQALTSPDILEGSSEDATKFLIKKLYSHKKFSKQHLLLIIYKMRRSDIKIITVIDTSKINKYFYS